MFNKTSNTYLLSCILVCSLFFVSACTKHKNISNNTAAGNIGASINNKKENIAEYIIVLNNRVKISDAINILEKYKVQVIKDLKRDRYVIKLTNDPGIKQLQKDLVGSNQIKHIQPNFIYNNK